MKEPMFKLELEEFHQIRDFIEKQSGLFFDDRKLYFVEKRVAKRIKENGFLSFVEYFRFLKFGRNSEEIASLIELLTTNETYFYRHLPQLESFVQEALPIVLDIKRSKGDNKIRLWSAASSSGEEIYTLAIMIHEQLPDIKRWKFEFMGTDIDRLILKKAKTAIYDTRSVKDVPKHVLAKYFTDLKDGRYQLKSSITSCVNFQHLNLIDRVAMRRYRGQDFIFCRNVLIYFEESSRKQVVNSLYDALNKGGFIFLGHSESVGRLSSAFKLVKFKRSLSYQK